MRKREDKQFKKSIQLSLASAIEQGQVKTQWLRVRATGICNHATLGFEGQTPEDINSGECFQWATIVFDLLEGSKISGHNLQGVGHTWIEYKNLCYDAEVPHGVKDWRDLPFWQRLKKEAGAKEFNRAVRRLG